jgi:acyl-CoA thioesterase
MENARTPAAAMWQADLASRGVGMVLLDVGDGSATIEMQVRDSMLNGHGICHGGFLFMLADSAFAFACNGGGDPVVAAAASIEFLAAAAEGDRLTATARRRVERGRSGVYDVTITRREEVIAEFRGRSSRRLAAPRPGSR